jgi:hypothetical protein
MSDHEKRDTHDLEPDKIPEELVRVQELPDEATGTMLCDFLGDQGIKATVQPVQIAWMPGVETMRHGYWGYLEVLERDVARARTLIHDFFAARPERGGTRRAPRDPGGEGPEDAA